MQLSRKRGYLAAIAVALAAGAWFSASGQSSAGPTRVPFSTVPTAKLAAPGLIFSTPTGGSAGPTSAAAARAGNAAAAAASKAFGGRSVLEYHYAHCVSTQSVPRLSQNCWAVSLDPSGLYSAGPEHQAATYMLVLIDPSNDQVIEEADGH